MTTWDKRKWLRGYKRKKAFYFFFILLLLFSSFFSYAIPLILFPLYLFYFCSSLHDSGQISNFKNWKRCCLTKRYLTLMKSCEIFELGRVIRFSYSFVFMLARGERKWGVFDSQFKSCKKPLIIPSDYKFQWEVEDSFSMGTRLFF